MFDVSKKRVRQTAAIELDEADGSPMMDDNGNRLSITVCGPGSKTWHQADAERARKQAARAEKNPRKMASAILDHRRDDETDFLLAVTVSFNGWGLPHPEGGEWPSQRDMWKSVYEDYEFGHIRAKVLKELDDFTAFMGNASTASPSTPANSPG